MAKHAQGQARTKWAPGATALASAAQAVLGVVSRGRSADDAFASFDKTPDRATIRAIGLGTLRWYLRLAPAINSLLKDPKSLPTEVHALLVAAAHQIEYSRNAPQATVHIAVDAARVLKHPRATGLINAVLRRFVAEREALFARLDAKEAIRTAHPEWLVKAIRSAWPDHAEQIFAANNLHPPMVLRLDTNQMERDNYIKALEVVDVPAHPVDWTPAAIELEKPVSIDMLPGFEEGLVSVQDAGAQIAAELLDVQPGMHVLDACSAPGGKMAHIIQRTPTVGYVVGVDVDEHRLERVRETLKRIAWNAPVVAADIRTWEVAERFDRVLVDAPCSSTGVIRRHPDIKLLRRPTDVPALSQVQLEILTAAFRVLKPGGRLIYGTCSVLPQENDETVRRFLANAPEARISRPNPPPAAMATEFGFQLLPGSKAGTDGFYYACVEKTTIGN